MGVDCGPPPDIEQSCIDIYMVEPPRRRTVDVSDFLSECGGATVIPSQGV